MRDVFSSEEVASALAGLGAASVTLQMYAQALLQQPVVTMDSVPNLARDLEGVHEVAHASLSLVMPQVLSVDAATIGFINELLAMYPRFIRLAWVIDGGGADRKDAATQFSEGLRLLGLNLAQQGPTLAKLAEGTQLLAQAITRVSVALTADAQAAASDAEISSLEAQINTALQAIDADCQVITQGLSGTDKALVKLAIQELNCEDDPKAAVKAFVGIILDTSAKVSGVIEAQDDIQRQLQTLLTLYAELDPLLAEAAVAQTAAQEAALMASSATRMQEAAQDIASAWKVLMEGFEALAVALTRDATVAPLTPALSAQQAGWEALLEDCKGWQSVGLFPVTVLPPPTAS